MYGLLFVNFSIVNIHNVTKLYVKLFKSCSYLTGVPAAELMGHLPDMNLIFNT